MFTNRDNEYVTFGIIVTDPISAPGIPRQTIEISSAATATNVLVLISPKPICNTTVYPTSYVTITNEVHHREQSPFVFRSLELNQRSMAH